MTTSINILPSGDYEVAVFLRDEAGYGRWHGLRCFASQGDARDFAAYDVSKFSIAELNQLVKTYDSGKSYKRMGFKRYKHD